MKRHSPIPLFHPAAWLSLLAVWSVSAQEIELFNGRDLTGWTVHTGNASFRVEDGCIVGKNLAAASSHTFLCTDAEYADFVLTFEFKADSGLNSGVQFRSELTRRDTQIEVDGRKKTLAADRVFGYQYEIDSLSWPTTGGVYDEGRRGLWLDEGSLLEGTSRPNDWNEGRIECQGDSIKTYLNGVPGSDFKDRSSRSGIIALQVHAKMRPGGEVRWRNIRLLPLTAGSKIPPIATVVGMNNLAPGRAPASAAPPLPPIQTDPNQPRIEVIRDQGPNASKWALAPLEEPIPANIRENLTYLREDLLDEAKSDPKADPAAYALGSEYCDKILAALEQRELARVNAGYRAAQANADIKVTNSQLDARRNHQMSWPQYQREESQRAALREQETNKADLKKEKVKVEWAGRVVKMRPVLDDLYRQVRAAMR